MSQRTFLEHAGLNARTSQSSLARSYRAWSEYVEASRIFAATDTEYATDLVNKRNYEQSRFGNYDTLALPSSGSYSPAFVFGSVSNLNAWNPTAAQRTAAEALLACKSLTNFNRQYRDSLPITVTYAKRPQYYAAVATDRIRVPRQAYGLGLLWNPVFGVALQSVSGTLGSNPWGSARSRPV